MSAGTGTAANFTHKLYFTELGNLFCIQKPMKVELLTLAGTGARSGRCWAHSRPSLPPFGAMVAPNFTGPDFIHAPSIPLCLQTLLRTVADFCFFTLLHSELVTIQKIPFLNTQDDCFSAFSISKRTYHILDHQVSGRKRNWVRRCRDWQHERIGAPYSSWYH